MDRKQEGGPVHLGCRQCIEDNSPCNGQIPCLRCRHYSLNCVYPSRAPPACLECSRDLSECNGETPCQRCRLWTLQCAYPTQAELDSRINASAVLASQSEESWPEQRSSQPRFEDTTATGARTGKGSLGAQETRHGCQEPDSYFMKEHNKGIDEDHLAKFKPNRKEWKKDRTV